MSFRFTGLALDQFSELFTLSDAELAARGMSRAVADAKPGYPCRVTLEEAEPGERLILLPFDHQLAQSPYKASGPIFVRERAQKAADIMDALPPVLTSGRVLSLRAYDALDCIVIAEVVQGTDTLKMIADFFARDDVSYIHVHNATRGCYACRVDRV